MVEKNLWGDGKEGGLSRVGGRYSSHNVSHQLVNFWILLLDCEISLTNVIILPDFLDAFTHFQLVTKYS